MRRASPPSSRTSGARAGDEVVQLYVKDLEASCAVPHHDLRGFQRIHLAPGESRKLSFELTARDLSLIDDSGRRVLEPGRFRVTIGGSQPDARSARADRPGAARDRVRRPVVSTHVDAECDVAVTHVRADAAPGETQLRGLPLGHDDCCC